MPMPGADILSLEQRYMAGNPAPAPQCLGCLPLMDLGNTRACSRVNLDAGDGRLARAGSHA